MSFRKKTRKGVKKLTIPKPAIIVAARATPLSLQYAHGCELPKDIPSHANPLSMLLLKRLQYSGKTKFAQIMQPTKTKNEITGINSIGKFSFSFSVIFSARKILPEKY